MRATIAGIIEGLNEILLRTDDKFVCERGDIVEISIPKEKRSKNANSYYWVLNGQLSKVTGIPGDLIYKNHIRDINCRECYFMLSEAVPRFEALWNSGHLGRFVETRESKEEGKTIVLAYYGSSDFDKRQMARLIDNCIQDCKANDIVTYDQEEVNRMVEAWKG